jgi:hypothetical protein
VGLHDGGQDGARFIEWDEDSGNYFFRFGDGIRRYQATALEKATTLEEAAASEEAPQ